MIASVSGTVAAIAPDGVVVEVGGVGLSVQCSPGTIAGLRAGEPARLATSLIVREDSLTLYGFATEDERSLFELLQTASGVGPRLAQAVLAVHQPDTVRRAVATGDVATLTRVPGIGKKGAERLILELKDRIGAIGAGGVAPAGASEPGWQVQVRQGLMGLGWAQREAEEAAAAVAVDAGPEPDVAALLKQAIRMLGRR
jgi:Holliday junction DNA helicase RuvA